MTTAGRVQIEGELEAKRCGSREQAATDAARPRKAQQDFLARGRVSLALALESGESYAMHEVLDAMKPWLDIARKAIAQVGDGGCTLRAMTYIERLIRKALEF